MKRGIENITVVTTLADHTVYSHEEIAWTTLLAYNLIRITAANAAALHDKPPRQISVTSTCQFVLASWQRLPDSSLTCDDLLNQCRILLRQISTCIVANVYECCKSLDCGHIIPHDLQSATALHACFSTQSASAEALSLFGRKETEPESAE